MYSNSIMHAGNIIIANHLDVWFTATIIVDFCKISFYFIDTNFIYLTLFFLCFLQISALEYIG